MKSDETTVFFNFISFDFSCRKQLAFFGWRFLFEIAFGRDFLGWTLLGRGASSDIVWYIFSKLVG